MLRGRRNDLLEVVGVAECFAMRFRSELVDNADTCTLCGKRSALIAGVARFDGRIGARSVEKAARQVELGRV